MPNEDEDENRPSPFLDKVVDAVKVKAQELWKYTRTRARLYLKLELLRTRRRVIRSLRDRYEPPVVPEWIGRELHKVSDDEVVELPYKPDAEPFLLVPLRLARVFEIDRGWLSGRVNGRDVRFVLPEDLKEQLHDPTLVLEIRELLELEEAAGRSDTDN